MVQRVGGIMVSGVSYESGDPGSNLSQILTKPARVDLRQVNKYDSLFERMDLT